MTREELDALWRDEAHWSFWCYRCARDPRLVVPKRRGFGWTVNFAHRGAAVFMVTLALCALMPPLAVIIHEGPALNPLHIFYAVGVSCIVSMALCLFFSRAKRD